MAGFRKSFEKKLASFRTYVHDSDLLLAFAAVFPLAIIATTFKAFNVEYKPTWDSSYLMTFVACLIILFYFVYALIWRFGTNAQNGVYPNLHTFIKATGGMLVIAFFTAIESALKDTNRVIAITLCLSFYFFLIISMILFKLSEDFDLAGAFLASSFSLFYESSQGMVEILVLVFISMILASLKCYLLGGKSLVLLNRFPSPVMVATGFIVNTEQSLARLRTRVRNSSLGLAYAASFTLFIFGLSLLALNQKHGLIPMGDMFCPCFLIFLFIIFHLRYAENRAFDDANEVEDLEVMDYPNLHSLIKGIGGQLVLFVFTAIDSCLKELSRSYAITLCTSIYLYLVIAMVFFRFSEDFDLAGAFLAAAYTLFYENSKGFDILALISVSIFLASLKSFLVGGENFREPQPPQLRL